jgi:hypothetical protein
VLGHEGTQAGVGSGTERDVIAITTTPHYNAVRYYTTQLCEIVGSMK